MTFGADDGQAPPGKTDKGKNGQNNQVVPKGCDTFPEPFLIEDHQAQNNGACQGSHKFPKLVGGSYKGSFLNHQTLEYRSPRCVEGFR